MATELTHQIIAMKMNEMHVNIQTSKAVRPELGTRKVAVRWR